MKKIFAFLTALVIGGGAAKAQNGIISPEVSDIHFQNKLEKLLNHSVPLISVDELKLRQNDVMVFDTREIDEYNVSHIPGAAYVGYKSFDPSKFRGLDTNTPIVLYCSVGYRSEKIGEKLQKEGFKNVYNLYGSIFEWANRGFPLENRQGQKVKKVHTYNRAWSKWMTNQEYEKTW